MRFSGGSFAGAIKRRNRLLYAVVHGLVKRASGYVEQVVQYSQYECVTTVSSFIVGL